MSNLTNSGFIRDGRYYKANIGKDENSASGYSSISVRENTDLSKDSTSTNIGSATLISSNLSPQLSSSAGLVFKTDYTPNNTLIYLDGVFMTNGSDYTISGKEITFSSEYEGLIKEGSMLSIVYTTIESN